MTNRILGLTLIAILLIIIDIYIYRAVKSMRWRSKDSSFFNFPYIWWGYSILLILGVFVSIFFNIKFVVRTVILVLFFVTFVSKVFILPFLLADDIRRGFIRLKRRFMPRPAKATGPVSPGKPIPRSEFLVKAGTLVAALPLGSLTYGMASSAYDYRIKQKTLVLPNLPSSFEGMKIAQISDVHS